MIIAFAAFVSPLPPPSARGATASEPPGFREVYDLIRSNLPALSDAELNRAVVEGLLVQFKNRVLLAQADAAPTDDSQRAALIAKSKQIEDGFGYIRISRIGAGLAKEFDAAHAGFGTNKLKGLVLDLRFATGGDYSAVAEVADRFIAKEDLLFKVGDASYRSTGRAEVLSLPLTVLVNRETASGAEVLAAVLRQRAGALVVGSTTAGQARPYRDFPLSNGETLKIGSGVVALANGTELGADGVAPDMPVTVTLAAEKVFLDEPYSVPPPPKLTTHRVDAPGRALRSPPINESELVRMHRAGIDIESILASPTVTERPSGQTIQDPVLARAVDLLKGIVVARNRR